MTEDEHWDRLNRSLARATAEHDRFIVASYRRDLAAGLNPAPPILSAERDAIDKGEAAARRALLPPYTGPVRHFGAVAFMYGEPPDLRDDEREINEHEHRRPWSYPR